jgi:hypothetical protein
MIKPAEARPPVAGAMRPGAVPQPAAPPTPQVQRKPAQPIPVPGAQT